MSIARIERIQALKALPNLSKARKKAPRHPIAPERRLRKAVRGLFADYHRHLVNIILALVRRRKRVQLDDGTEDIKGALKSARAYGGFLLAHGSFKHETRGAAKDTAHSAIKQTQKAVKREVTTDLDDQQADFAGWIERNSDEKMDASIDRARDVYDTWDELPEDAEDYEDEDALEERLDSGLDGIMGSALAYASMAFAGAFADMIKGAQEDAGVASYTWLSTLDSRVRPSHEALDGQVADWDDPPLQPGEEPVGDPSIDEPAHPGEAPNCRCVASPIDPDQESDAESN